ncbi:MAG: hypothetical protein KAI81_08140, partial [Candidatus Marinimicrobia bacterium]|nr:hypothetical protein [Candidatus Neomarinimicrobiota bacterium]
MAVISVRLNKEEEKVLNYLSKYFNKDKSTLFKKSLMELYEDIQDIKFVNSYIKSENKKEKNYITADELFE